MKWGRILLALFVLAALAAGGAFLLREHIVNYWIKRQLAAQLSRALNADVDLHGVRWENGVLHTKRLRMAGGQLPFVRLESRELRALVDWRRLLEPTEEPLHIEVAEADVTWRPVDDTPAAQSSGATNIIVPALDLLIGKLNFRHSDNRGWSVDGSAVRARRENDTWSVSGSGGTLSVDGWPPLAIERFSAEHSGDRWHIGSFALKDADGGAVAGSATHENGTWGAEFSWQDLALGALLPADTAKHLEGKSSGDAVMKDGVLRGQMKIADASTKTVGLLVKIAGMLEGEDWSDVPWKIFRFDFVRHNNGRVEFSDLQMLSPKGLAVRGSGHFAPDSLGADLQVGIRREGRPYLGAFVPVLFSHERDGYYWTPLKVGGTPSAPKEDLTTRIVAALAIAPAVGAAETAAEVPGEAAEAVGGLLRNLLRH